MSAPTAAPAKKKSKLKMPHLLFLMLGLILLMSLLTYIVPAGQFATDPETGALIGDEFHLLGHQTPVNIWQALNYILPGFMNSSYVISLLLISGGCVGVIMGTGAFDEMVNWALYKLQDKGVSVLVPIVFMVIAIHGGFGGGDSMIALVPLGVMMAKKLRLDPIMAVALTFFASFTGFAVGPRRISTAQLMMDVPMYSGFVERTVILLVIITIGMLYTLHYARKIAKDPTKSAMGNTDWMETYHAETGDEMEVVAFNPRAALVTVLFFAQYFVIVYMMTVLGMANTIMPAVQIPVAILCGLIYGQNLDKIGAAFAKGHLRHGLRCGCDRSGRHHVARYGKRQYPAHHRLLRLPAPAGTLPWSGLGGYVGNRRLPEPVRSVRFGKDGNPDPHHQADGRKPGHVRQPGCFRIPVR